MYNENECNYMKNLTINEVIMDVCWPAVIIMQGVPYVLTRQSKTVVNDVCQLCDLKDICQNGNDIYKLLDICTREDQDEGWFFAEDWDILDFDLKDFVQYENR